MDILILALSRWDGKYSSTILSLSKVLAVSNRVFYVGNPFTIRELIVHFFTFHIQKRLPTLLFGSKPFSKPLHDLPNFVAITPRITYSINWLSSGSVFSFFQHRNDQIVYKAIRKAIKKYEIKDFIYVNSFNPNFGNHFPASFRPKMTIYHCVDDISKSPYIAKHGTRLEQLVVRKADLVLTTSSELARLKSKESVQVQILLNAANVTLFQTAANRILAIPPELQKISSKKKVITYIGNICHRLDYALLMAISIQLPDHLLLMVGPFSNNSYRGSGLYAQPNVIFTGQRKLEELPAYLQYSHCCIIPFLCNTLTRSIYPLKINEYLSTGKPVVTTPFSEDIQSFAQVVGIATSHQEFIQKVEEAIMTDSPALRKTRMTYAASNSWEERAKEFWKIIDERGSDEKEKGRNVQAV